MMTLHQINEEIEYLIGEIRALDRVLFNVDTKFLYQLVQQKKKMWNRVNFLKAMKKLYIVNKSCF